MPEALTDSSDKWLQRIGEIALHSGCPVCRLVGGGTRASPLGDWTVSSCDIPLSPLPVPFTGVPLLVPLDVVEELEVEEELASDCARAVPWESTNTRTTPNAAQARKNPRQKVGIWVIVRPPTASGNHDGVAWPENNVLLEVLAFDDFVVIEPVLFRLSFDVAHDVDLLALGEIAKPAGLRD